MFYSWKERTLKNILQRLILPEESIRMATEIDNRINQIRNLYHVDVGSFRNMQLNAVQAGVYEGELRNDNPRYISDEDGAYFAVNVLIYLEVARNKIRDDAQFNAIYALVKTAYLMHELAPYRKFGIKIGMTSLDERERYWGYLESTIQKETVFIPQMILSL